MSQLTYLIFGAIAGGLAVGFWMWRGISSIKTMHGQGEKPEPLIKRQAREKEENKRSTLGILETQTPLTNNHIEQLLGISDATATRYLDELEKEGLIRQVGKTGKHVYYEKI